MPRRVTSNAHLFVLAALVACGGPTSVQRDDTDPAESTTLSPPAGRLDPEVRPTHYALTFAIDPAREGFTGVAEIDVDLPRAQSVVYLHAQGLDVSDASVAEAGEDASPATFAVVDEARQVASVTLPRPMGPGPVRLRITYGAAFDQSLEGLYRVEQGDDAYAFTQMEPLGARKAFPCFDEPSFKTPFDVTLVIPEAQHGIANAAEIHSEPTTGGMKRVRFATTEPLPTYLIALAVGPFDIVEGDPIPPNEVRTEPLPFRAVAARGQGAALQHVLTRTPAILAALEGYFGIAYPFDKLDILAVPDFAAGAMENPGAVTFRDSLLLVNEGASIAQQRAYAYVMAHELAHMWFGDLVTMQWWDDLWLNEAFATWMETRTIEETFPAFDPQVNEMDVVLEAMSSDSLVSARQIRQPIETQHDIHNAFDAITYSKGNAVLSMFEQWLTPEVFRDGVRAYMTEHARGNATAEDLLRALSAAAGRDVSAPFSSFLEQPGVPLVEVTPQCQDGQGSLSLRQSRYLPLGSSGDAAQRWQIPVCARYAAGSEVRQQCTLLTDAEGTLELEGGCPDWVLPNGGGRGYYRWTLPAESMTALRERGLSALTTREAMSYVDSVEAGFRAGRISYADALAAVAPLADREERALASAPMSLIRFALRHALSTDEARAHARTYASTLYRGQLRRVGYTARPGESPDRKLWRAALIEFLARIAEDPAVRRELARRGRSYIDGDLTAVEPDLAIAAVTVAVQDGGAEVFDHALTRFREATDPMVRSNLLRGLCGARAPEQRARVLALALDDDLRLNEVFRPLMIQTEEPATRDEAFAWITEHYDALAARMGPGFAGYLPYAASSFCSPERAQEARTFFASRVEATQGGPRNLESAVEHITLCAAARAYAEESAEARFAR